MGGFRQVVKDGFYRSFDLNLNIMKGNVVYFTLVVFVPCFFFTCSLCLLRFYILSHLSPRNAGKDISKKRYFLHVNGIM